MGARGRAGGWTVAALADLPDDGNRYEVIDGNLVVSPPPPVWHQTVGSVLMAQLLRGVPAEWAVVYESLFDYGGDGRVPDLLVVRREAARDRRALGYRAVDIGLVVEIVSASSRRTDRLAKPAEYAEQGVPLMWRVELEPVVAVHPFVLRGTTWDAGPAVTGRGLLPVPWGEVDVDLADLNDGSPA